MDKLHEFFNDKAMMEEVYNHFIDYLNRTAIARAYERKDVAGIADAKDALDGALTELKDKYGEKQKPKTISNR